MNLHEILRRNKSERARWAVHVARFREAINSYTWVGKPKGKRLVEDLSVDGRTILS